MRMSGEQAMLCEVKKQQLKVLDDQQRVYADDLSKSVVTIIPPTKEFQSADHCLELTGPGDRLL